MLINIDYKEKENNRKIKELKTSNRLLKKDVKAIAKQVEELKATKEAKNIQLEEIADLTTNNEYLVSALNSLKGEIKTIANELV